MKTLILVLCLSSVAIAQSMSEQAHILNLKLFRAWDAHEKAYNRIYAHHRAESSITPEQAKKEEAKALQEYEKALIPLVDEARTLYYRWTQGCKNIPEGNKWQLLFSGERRMSMIADAGLGVYLEKLAKTQQPNGCQGPILVGK